MSNRRLSQPYSVDPIDPDEELSAEIINERLERIQTDFEALFQQNVNADSLLSDEFNDLLGGFSDGYLINDSGLSTGPLSIQAVPIPVIDGGTGLIVYAVGDLLYASATTTLAKLAVGAAGKIIRSNGTLPVYSTFTIPDTYAVGDLLYGSATNVLSALADVAAGSYLRSGGVTTAPVWSTLTLPNAATTGDILYASAANVLSMLADVATGNALISGGIGVAPAWGKIGLTTHVSGILPIANGGTNSSTALSGSSIVVSNGSALIQGAAGTTSTVLHGDAAGAPTYGQVALASEVSGDLPFANFVQASAASRLVGRGSAAGAGDFQEITLGTGLSMSGTALSATATGTVDTTGTPANNQLAIFTDADTIEGDANLTWDGTTFAIGTTGPHGIGGGGTATVLLHIRGSFAPGSGSPIYGILSEPALTLPINAEGRWSQYGGTVIKAGSGTHPQVSTLRLDPVGLTSGTAAITTASNLHIPSAPTIGTNNYAIQVDGGVSKFGGQILGIVGTAGAPSFCSSGDQNTGLYFNDADSLFVSTGGSAALQIDGSNNLRIAGSAPGTDGTHVLVIPNGTVPSTSPADKIQIFSVDISAGNASLGLRTETAVQSAATVSDRYLNIHVNGTTYKLLLST